MPTTKLTIRFANVKTCEQIDNCKSVTLSTNTAMSCLSAPFASPTRAAELTEGAMWEVRSRPRPE